MTELYDQQLSEGVHQFAEGGNMKPSFKERIIEWVLDAWPQLSKENTITSFKSCDLNLANDGTKDEFIHCLKKGRSYEAGKLN